MITNRRTKRKSKNVDVSTTSGMREEETLDGEG